MVNIPNLVLSVALVVVIALGAAGVATRQLVATVRPNPMAPNYLCTVTLFFHNRRTECPGRAVINYRTPRKEGFFECVSAYDKWIASFALALLGCITAFFALLLSVAAAFVPPTTTTVRARAFIIAGLSVASCIFFLVSWPLTHANLTQDQCGRPLEGYVMTTHTKILKASFGHGHGLVISAWCVSVVAMVISVVVAVFTKNPVLNAKDETEDADGKKNAPDADDELAVISGPDAPAPSVYGVPAPAAATAALATV